MNTQDKTIIQSLPGNSQCIDCSSPNPTWASVNNGTLHCFDCIGRHRGLGVHISFAKSIDLDTWEKESDVNMMKLGCNENFRNFMMEHTTSSISTGTCMEESKDVALLVFEFGRTYIRNVYDNPIAELYRKILKLNNIQGNVKTILLPTDDELKEAKVKMQIHHQTQEQQKQQSTTTTTTMKPTLSSHLMRNVLPTPIQCFSSGLKYYVYKYVITPIQTYPKISFITFITYLISKYCKRITHSNHHTNNHNNTNSYHHQFYTYGTIVSTIYSKAIMTYSSFIILLSITSIIWIRKHRQDTFKSTYNQFQEKINQGFIKRNTNYDIYFPMQKNSDSIISIGSSVDKAFIFYPESLVDITSYCNVMSQLSKMGGVLVIVMNYNPTRIVSPYHHVNGSSSSNNIGSMMMMNKSTSLNNCFQVIYHIEKLMGIQVKEWILGGHGDGANVVLTLRHSIELNQMRMKRSNTVMKCVLWGLSSASSLSLLNNDVDRLDKTLFITASNDLIAGKYRFENVLSSTLLSSSNGESTMMKKTSTRILHYYNIEGGNHSAFGHYGPQTFPIHDGHCVKTIHLQQKECVMRTLDFILDREHDASLSSSKND